VQEAGIDPDIIVPQLSDENYSERTILREADLRYHLRNEAVKNDRLLEDDATTDPRFKENAEGLKKRGVTDFQLDYALSILNRLEAPVAPKTIAKR
jgi:carboxyl-terminal processing protease